MSWEGCPSVGVSRPENARPREPISLCVVDTNLLLYAWSRGGLIYLIVGLRWWDSERGGRLEGWLLRRPRSLAWLGAQQRGPNELA